MIDLQVTAMVEPKWVSDKPKNTTLRLHHQETLTLNCSASGVPEPRYRWTKDGEEITEEEMGEEEDKEAIEEEGRGGGGRGINVPSFPILKGRVKHEGLYVCEVKNRAGSLLAWYKVEFLHPHALVPKPDPKLIVLPVMVSVLLVFGWCLYNQWRSYKYSLQAARAWKEGNVEALSKSLSLRDQAHLLPFKPKFEISRHQITFDKMLGCGAFGRVYRATADLSPEETNVTVAVKMIKARTDKAQLLALQSELKILMHIGKHVNIVNLVATCTKNIHKKDLMLVVEYCRFGNILDYMRRHRASFVNQLTENGEEFLPSLGQSPSESGSGAEENEGSGNKVYISAGRVVFNAGAAQSTAPVDTTTGFSTFGYSRQALVSGRGGQGLMSHTSAANTNLGSDMTCVSLITDTHNLESPNLPFDRESLSRPLCSRDLLCWGFQVARGMDFLAYRKVLHGDLAARNVLLTEGNLVKISDFGLAEDIYKYNNYKKDKNSPLPVKWMSVEALKDGIFSTQSDVWAYGVVLWEIFSLGQCPFPGVTVDESFIKSLEDGYRMERPKFSTKPLYQVMLDCWNTEPESRPCFTTLQGRLSKMLTAGDSKYYEDLQKAVEAKEALEKEEEEQESTYLNMVRNVDYANIVQANNHDEEPVEYANADDYIKISSVQQATEGPEVVVQYVSNRGYVSLSNAENLMVSNGGSGDCEAVQEEFKGSADEAAKEEDLLCL